MPIIPSLAKYDALMAENAGADQQAKKHMAESSELDKHGKTEFEQMNINDFFFRKSLDLSEKKQVV